MLSTQITDILTDGLDITHYLSTTFFCGHAGRYLHARVSDRTDAFTQGDLYARQELLYWAAILCTFARGTAAGDLVTEALGMGFQWGVVVFGVLIAITVAAYRLGVNLVLTFWVAYILTRPLGAAMGGLLSQATTYGGLGFGAMKTSAVFLVRIVGLVAVAQRNARQITIAGAR